MSDTIMYLTKWTTIEEPVRFLDGKIDEDALPTPVEYAPGYVDVSVHPELKPFCIPERPR